MLRNGTVNFAEFPTAQTERARADKLIAITAVEAASF
jgi:hypothetical protein